jgi:hypothetical protein
MAKTKPALGCRRILVTDGDGMILGTWECRCAGDIGEFTKRLEDELGTALERLDLAECERCGDWVRAILLREIGGPKHPRWVCPKCGSASGA